jgi:hypothetical protein
MEKIPKTHQFCGLETLFNIALLSEIVASPSFPLIGGW